MRTVKLQSVLKFGQKREAFKHSVKDAHAFIVYKPKGTNYGSSLDEIHEELM